MTPWTRSEVLALAREGCTHCFGLGLCFHSRRKALAPCNCVLREIFRCCYRRFQYGMLEEPGISRVTADAARQFWSMKNEEFLADFVILARRTLGAESLGHRIFCLHFLLGGDWVACCARLKISRGAFFHWVYRIEQRLGLAFRSEGLFPVRGYFAPPDRNAKPFAVEAA